MYGTQCCSFVRHTFGSIQVSLGWDQMGIWCVRQTAPKEWKDHSCSKIELPKSLLFTPSFVGFFNALTAINPQLRLLFLKGEQASKYVVGNRKEYVCSSTTMQLQCYVVQKCFGTVFRGFLQLCVFFMPYFCNYIHMCIVGILL